MSPNLPSLSPEEIQKMMAILQYMANQNPSEEPPKKIRKKRAATKAQTIPKSHKTVKKRDNKPVAQPRKPTKAKSQRERSRLAATQPIDTISKRVNKFETMSIFNQHKDDVAIDKLLSKEPPVPREREVYYVEVNCRVCGKSVEILEHLVGNDSGVTCDACCTRRSGR